ncbi:hypothetical protein [Ignavibacterium sp.]|uniref:hypothetical protein n=1 Tax=Ignavibacterium sp. TaxID=2651167 RepID=UPI002206510F|nr:hypothetical protein [Ignavibacterium sp.]BDQ01551.1 MAG: hypothetical protein KatS3mg037_0126 [Ignavibacterium sp.]
MDFHLDDLCGQPVNHLENRKQKKIRTSLRSFYEPDFEKRLAIYKPQFLIITPKAISKNIINSLLFANLNVPYRELPLPAGSGTNANNYVRELKKVLNEINKRKT